MRNTLRILLLSTALSTSAMAQVTSPPFYSVLWSPLNPDMAGIISTDRSAGAALVIFDTSWAMPAVTSDFRLQITSDQTGTIVFHGIVQGVPGQPPTTTWTSLTADLCNQINNNEVLKAHNVACQLTGTSFGVTHFTDNNLTVTPLTGTPLIRVDNGSLGWDAGPIFFLNRSPGFGAVPPPGSNCGQIVFGAPTTATPGLAGAQYVTIGCTVDNSDANNVAGSFHLYTASTIFGLPLLRERLVINSLGMFLDGAQVCVKGKPC